MTEFTTWRSLVDGAEISAIPDSVVKDSQWYYDPRSEDANDNDTLTQLTDQGDEGNNATVLDGETGADYVESGINGFPSYSWDDDGMEVSFSNLTEFYFIAVLRWDGPGDERNVFMRNDKISSSMITARRNDQWSSNAHDTGANDLIESTSGEEIIFEMFRESSENFEFRLHPLDDFTFDADPREVDKVLFGRHGSLDRHYEGLSGEMALISPVPSASERQDIREYISNEWDIDLLSD